jgi:hypothetical protein
MPPSAFKVISIHDHGEPGARRVVVSACRGVSVQGNHQQHGRVMIGGRSGD